MGIVYSVCMCSSGDGVTSCNRNGPGLCMSDWGSSKNVVVF